MSKKPTFPFEKLDAYKVAKQAREVAFRFAESVPGHARERGQIKDASASTVRNLAEGACRWKPAEKIHKFEIAQAEAGEAVAAVAGLVGCGLGNQELAAEFLTLENRVGAMLTKLIHRQRQR